MKPIFKRGLPLLLALGLVLSLAACGQPAAEEPEGNPTQAMAFMADPGDCTPLTADEIAWFNTEFFNNSYPYHTNQMVYSLYNAPEEINLFETFSNSVENWALDEKAAVDAKIASDGDNNVFVKNSVATMNETLETYTGLTLDAMDGIGLEEMTYFEEYDAYYHYGYGATASEVQVFYGERDGDGNVFLAYTWSYWSHPSGWLLHLTEQPDGSYHFVSNREPGLSDDGGDLPQASGAAKNAAFGAYYDLLSVVDYAHMPEFPDPEELDSYELSVMAETPVLDYRMTDLSLVRETDVDGTLVQTYRYSFSLRPKAGVDLTSGSEYVALADGWVTTTPGAHYLIHWLPEGMDDAYGEVMYQPVVITDLQPEDEGFDARIAQLAEGRPQIAAADPVTELRLLFADDSKLLFSSDSFLCFYDLAEARVDALLNFTPGEPDGGRSGLTLLRDDGTPVELYLYGRLADMGMSWQLPEVYTKEGKWFPKGPTRSAGTEITDYELGNDLPEGIESWPVAIAVELVPSGLVPQAGGVVSEVAMPFDDGTTGYLQSSDGTVGGITYVRSPQASVTIFDGYFSAGAE